MSEASIRTQWKKGQSGNPKGRPKTPKPLRDQGELLTHLARKLLDQPCHVLGSDTQLTRRTRFMLDVLERAEQGEMSCVKLLFDLADRGDRRRLQALRAAGRARAAEDKELEYRLADMVAEMTPGLRPDQQHVVLPARERRTEHLKRPKPGREPRYEINRYARESDPLAGVQKHIVREGDYKYRPYPADAPPLAGHAPSARAVADVPGHPEDTDPYAPAPRDYLLRMMRAREAALERGPETGPGTGVITGPITGLSGVFVPPQAVEGSRKSELLNGACDFSNLHNGHIAHVNGTP